ncbi:MAG: cytochrome c oxidase subunit II [Gemmatimonadota bacterium]
MKEPRRTVEVVAVMALFVGIALLTLVGFSRDWMPEVASRHGSGVDGVVRYLLLTTGTVVLVGSTALVVFLWRYARDRPTDRPRLRPRTEYWWSLVPVLGMALIAELGVLLKGLPVWEQVYGEVPADALTVEVMAKQFEWLVRYPGPDGAFGRTDPALVEGRTNPLGLDPADPAGADDVVVRNALHVPEARTVHVRLRARDVLHSFSVPAFRVKQDIVPGITGRAVFVPTRPGRYEIACAELCGMGHYRMRGAVVVHPATEFDRWLTEQTEAAR